MPPSENTHTSTPEPGPVPSEASDADLKRVRAFEVRLAIIAAETNAPLLDANRPLGDEMNYTELFDAAQQGICPMAGFSPPWKASRRPSFWSRYMEVDPGSVNGNKAWRKLVPLRYSVPLTVTADPPVTSVALIGYLYPFGRTLLVTVNLVADGDGLSLEDLVSHVLALRNDQRYKHEGRTLTLLELIELGFDRFRSETGGGSGSLPDLFSVLTVIRGEDSDPVAPPLKDEMQRLLYALSSGSMQFRNEILESWTDAVVPIRRRAPKEHWVYGTPRGRAVWFPFLFSDPGERTRHPLGVYHRNLVACSVQTESLCRLILTAANNVSGWTTQTNIYPMIKNAVDRLTQLYVGKGTYKTGSAKIHIEQTEGYLSAVNAARAGAHMEGSFTFEPRAPSNDTTIV